MLLVLPVLYNITTVCPIKLIYLYILFLDSWSISSLIWMHMHTSWLALVLIAPYKSWTKWRKSINSKSNVTYLCFWKGYHDVLKQHLQKATAEKGQLEETAAELGDRAEKLKYELAEAHEAARSRDEVISLLEDQLNNLETLYTKSLEESQRHKLRLGNLEQELKHLKEVCAKVSHCSWLYILRFNTGCNVKSSSDSFKLHTILYWFYKIFWIISKCIQFLSLYKPICFLFITVSNRV